MPRTLLSALLHLGEDNTEVQEIELDRIRLNPNQPREYFEPESIEELAASIQAVGLIQPIVVRRIAEGDYELVAGERRIRACRKLGMARIHAIVRRLSEPEAMALALIENLQRENLTPIEEARAYRAIMDKFNLSQQQLAEKVGKSQPLISNLLKLLNLPEEVQQLVSVGKLNQGQGRALTLLDSPQLIKRMARRAVDKDWTAKHLERIVREITERDEDGQPASEPHHPSRIQGFVEQLNLFRASVFDSINSVSRKVGIEVATEERDDDEYYEIVFRIRKTDRAQARRILEQDQGGPAPEPDPGDSSGYSD